MSQVRHILEDFSLEKVLKSTARTTVFRATDPATDRRVAIKLIDPAAAAVDEINRSSFLYAAEVAKSGALRGLPRVTDFGLTPDDQAFLVTDMVDLAIPVTDLSNDTSQRRVTIARGLAETLDGLAMAGAAHLNLSLDNILVTVDNSVLLCGYGTAAYLAGAPTGIWPGTDDRYAAPELAQEDSLRRVDLFRADLYSLALVTCDLLGATISDLGSDAVAVKLPTDLPVVKEELATALSTALQPDPSARSTSVSELRRALSEDESGAVDSAIDAVFDGTGFETREITTPLVLDPLPTAAAEVNPAPAGEPSPVTPVGGEPKTPMAPEVVPEPEGGTAGADFSEPVPPQPPVAAPAMAEGKEKPGGGFRWDIVLPVAAAVLMVVVVSLFVIGRSERTTEQVAVATAVPTVRPTPSPVVVEDMAPAINPFLEQAEQLLLSGDLDATRRLLAEFSDDLVAQFNEEELELFEGLKDSVEGEAQARSISDLTRGLELGSIRMIRRGVAGVSRIPANERAAIPGLDERLQHGRTALGAHQRLGEAEKSGDLYAVMDRAAELISILPDYSRSYTLREDAAVGLEARAEAAISNEDLEGAVDVLRGLQSRWPDRPGVAARITWCETELRADRALENLLAEARGAGERGDFEIGIGLLETARAEGDDQLRVAALLRDLSEQLAARDADGPAISVDGSFEAKFKKNETVVVPVIVTDDYRVERVVAWIAAGSSPEYREIALQSAGNDQYPLEIGPDLHGNQDVVYYVVATDRSGHQAFFGSPDAPFKIERVKWFNKVIP